MATGVVPWDTCAATECNGARTGAGTSCLVHLPPEALAASLSAAASVPVDLDGRGVHFDRDSLQRVLDALPVDDSGGLLLGTVRLDQATFDHGLPLDNARFRGPVSMTGAVCKGDARFGGAAFGSTADFGGTTFGGQAWFVGATFAGPASFRAVRFQGPAWFQQVTFGGEACFDAAVFSFNATLSSARFDRVASFAGAGFERRARFERSTAAGGWRFDATRFREEPEGLPLGAYQPESAAVAPPDTPPVEGRSPAARKRAPKARRRSVMALQVLAGVSIVAVLAYIVLRSEPKTTTFTDYAFLLENPKTQAPARWNACEPIRYVVNAEEAPPGGLEELNQALTRVSVATGLTFVSEGSTTEKVTLGPGVAGGPADRGPRLAGSSESRSEIVGTSEDPKLFATMYQTSLNRPSFQPSRYGKDRWAPVLLGWSSFPELNAGSPAPLTGVASGDPRDDGNGNTLYVSGLALFNPTTSQRFARGEILHQLGHLVGLAHVTSGDELMAPTDRRQNEFGNGDLEGLRRVGVRGGGCVATPPPRA